MLRLTKDLVYELLEILTPFIQQPRRASAPLITTKVLATLRFYASGSHQEITGSNHFVGISQASMSRAIKEVTLNQTQILASKVSFLKDPEEQEALRRRFHSIYNFPGIVGIVDCTHVAIASP
ncbi:unnamed protein product [Acanthoscelides obtectus]|uniref:Nuclease HARBI1 n=1 Tax=Acanthoscelides obtectus TaxID=200917 RepID=A0A9P0KG80_ACAOB|nr:unnamed protein product [Acanthoscelides obtectus]CAK1640888.1 Putative nuclease HARBI1 [Acanthoscelides obtectus]